MKKGEKNENPGHLHGNKALSARKHQEFSVRKLSTNCLTESLQGFHLLVIYRDYGICLKVGVNTQLCKQHRNINNNISQLIIFFCVFFIFLNGWSCCWVQSLEFFLQKSKYYSGSTHISVSGRTQFIIKPFKFHTSHVSSGVPQGSVLGPFCS